MTPAGIRAPTLREALPWGLAIGAAVHAYWYGWSTLAPRFVDWLGFGDLATSFLGWHFFRHEPWSFPLTTLRNYGEGLGASIVLTDSIPLVTMALKPFSAWLPPTFQYFGLWVLACYVLNAAFAYALLGRFTGSRLARAGGAALVTLAPFVTWRGASHLSLVAQWLPLAAAWLYFTPQPRRPFKWALLLAAAVLVNPYFFGMVGVVWVAAVAADLADAPPGRARAAVGAGAAATLAGVAAVAWVCGLFEAAGTASGFGGYGRAPLDLLSWIDARATGQLNPGFQKGLDDGSEGFAYLGLGAVAVIAVGLLAWLLRPRAPDRRQAIFIAAMAVLVLFAITHRVHFAGRLVLELPLPEALERAASVFRSSGRFGWLPGYALLVAAIALVANRLPRPASAALLVLALALTHADWRKEREHVQALLHPKFVQWSPEQRALVEALPQGYRRLVFVPQHHLWLGNIDRIWGFALAAAERDMAINVAYLARVDFQRFEAQAARIRDELRQGRLDPASAYLSRNAAFAQDLPQPAAAAARVAQADGYHVILPTAPSSAPGPLAAATTVAALAAPGALDVEFGASGDGRFYMESGWTIPAPWGTWSEGPSATLRLPAMAPAPGPRKLRVYGQAYFHRGGQQVEVRVNGQAVATWDYASRDPQWREAELPPAATSRPMRVELRFANPQRPADAPGDLSRDPRLLGVALMQLQVTAGSPAR